MSTPAAGTKLAQFGVIGLGVMGQNLALNIEDHGFSVAVWNYETEWVDQFLQKNSGRKLQGSKTLQEFVQSLARPRMTRAGRISGSRKGGEVCLSE